MSYKQFKNLISVQRDKKTFYFLDKFVPPPPPPPPSPSVSVTPTPTITPTPTPTLAVCDLTYEVINTLTYTVDTTLATPNNTTTSPTILAYSGTGFTEYDTTDYQYTIYWGDGNSDTLYYNSASSFVSRTTHTYSTSGTYQIEIKVPDGQVFHSIGFGDITENNNKKIISLDDWGNQFELSGFGRLSGNFIGCSNFVSMAQLDTSNVNSSVIFGGMDSTFESATSFTGDTTNWELSGATSLYKIFRKASSFNQDITGWDTSNITDFRDLFYSATTFNHSLGSWDISSGIYMSDMLSYCGMSTSNYDATLIGWEGQASTPSGITLGATGLTYTLGGAAEAARTSLITTYGWTINGDSGV